jgi:hypothetical protein
VSDPPTESAPVSDAPDERAAAGDSETHEVSGHERRFEIVATVRLALTALATAWSGYQASLWDGIQSSNYTQASPLRTEGSLDHTEANQIRRGDLSVFENFVDATLDGDTELANFYRQRFRDEFEPAFAAWIALDPFSSARASLLGMAAVGLVGGTVLMVAQPVTTG